MRITKLTTPAEVVMYATLKSIARDYLTLPQMEKDAKMQGLSHVEYLEMVIQNMKADAARAIGVKPR